MYQICSTQLIILCLQLTDGTDFFNFNFTQAIMFPTGVNSSVCETPIIIDDNILENNEFFSVSISVFDPGVDLGSIGNTTIIIVDNDGNLTTG